MLKSIVIFEKEVMPHPGIVTLLWSVTVTSQRDFKVCQLQRRVLNENPLFVLLYTQSVASNFSHAEGLNFYALRKVPVLSAGIQT